MMITVLHSYILSFDIVPFRSRVRNSLDQFLTLD